MAQSLLQLLNTVITGAPDISNVLLQFSKTFLSESSAPQITHFLVPAICEMASTFPLCPLIESLVKVDVTQANQRITLTPQINIGSIKLNMNPTPSLVYNLLQIGKSRKGNYDLNNAKLCTLHKIYDTILLT